MKTHLKSILIVFTWVAFPNDLMENSRGKSKQNGANQPVTAKVH